MRVLHVIDKSFIGGGQTAVLRLLQGSRDHGVHTELACRAGGPLVEAAGALGAQVHAVPFDKRFRPGPARAVARIAAASSIDVVHGHGLVATFYCTLARRFFGLGSPLIYDQHGFHHHNYGALTVGLRKATERAVCRRADAVISGCTSDDDRLLDEGYVDRDRLHLIYYGIPVPEAPPAEVAAVRRELGLVDGVPVVGIVGRLHPQKGIDVFLRAAAAVAGRARAQFLVVGGGELEGPLRAEASALGLDGRLHWAGSRSDVPFLPLLDVAVLSSNWEGLPFVLLEYMATGRAIVTTDVPGCLDAVGPDEAEIVPRGDDSALAEGVLRLLADPGLAATRSAAARRRFAKQFSLETMTGCFAGLYEELLSCAR
jgi:glycosyltransferase involved in cell wall biosynthesis